MRAIFKFTHETAETHRSLRSESKDSREKEEAKRDGEREEGEERGEAEDS